MEGKAFATEHKRDYRIGNSIRKPRGFANDRLARPTIHQLQTTRADKSQPPNLTCITTHFVTFQESLQKMVAQVEAGGSVLALTKIT